MESLAILVVWLFILVHLTGPIALALAYYDFWLAGGLLGVAAIGLGVQWYSGVYTWPRYLGLVSAGMGLSAVVLVFRRLML
jgi:hypothetical protein